MNNKESIPNRPKDSVACKIAFQFTPSLAGLTPWILQVLDEECGGWLVHWEQCRVRNGKVAASSSLLVFSGQADLSCFFPTISAF